MKVKLIVDNREIEIEITEEELDKLKLSKRKTGYERAGDYSICITDDMTLNECQDELPSVYGV